MSANPSALRPTAKKHGSAGFSAGRRRNGLANARPRLVGHGLGPLEAWPDSLRVSLGALADNREVHLILFGIMMPESMNGFDLAAEVRRRRPVLPFLLTTDHAGVSIDNAALRPIAVLSKTDGMAALDAALRMALARGSDDG
jgi:DNA-binding response OmpR family regulator